MRKRKKEKLERERVSTMQCLRHTTMCLPSKLTNGICGPTSHSTFFNACLIPNGYYFLSSYFNIFFYNF